MTLRRVWHRLLSVAYTRAHWWATLYAKWALPLVGEGAIPWATPRTPFHHGRIALVTAAGVHRVGDVPFDMESRAGDASFRVIPGDAAAADLMITHDYYDHSAADRDVNVRFRMGQVLGEPGAAAQQRRVLWDALGAFARIREPGGTIELPYRWKRGSYTDPLAEGPAR